MDVGVGERKPDNVLNSLKVKSRIAFQAIYSRRVSTLQCTVEPFELGLLQEVFLEEGQDLGKVPYNWFFLPRMCFHVLPTKPTRPSLAEQLRRKFWELQQTQGRQEGRYCSEKRDKKREARSKTRRCKCIVQEQSPHETICVKTLNSEPWSVYSSLFQWIRIIVCLKVDQKYQGVLTQDHWDRLETVTSNTSKYL